MVMFRKKPQMKAAKVITDFLKEKMTPESAQMIIPHNFQINTNWSTNEMKCSGEMIFVHKGGLLKIKFESIGNVISEELWDCIRKVM